jgi:FMN phosphatase YigB (HAD superfamily)
MRQRTALKRVDTPQPLRASPTEYTASSAAAREGPMAPDSEQIVFLFDVDNTLLDNDAIQNDLGEHLRREFGEASRERYWALFEQLRAELGYADYLGALQRYRLENLDDPQLLQISFFLIDYPFAQRLYPGALAALAHCGRAGLTVILSDGDVVFQPRKVQRSGLWDAVGGRVLIYLHKEQMLDAVARRYPAARYVIIDDKLRILTAIKQVWGERVTTVFPRQGHYALDPRESAAYAPPDLILANIGELATLSVGTLLGIAAPQRLG